MSGVEVVAIPIAIEVSVVVINYLWSTACELGDVSQEFKLLFSTFHQAQLDLKVAKSYYDMIPKYDERHSDLKSWASMTIGETQNLLNEFSKHFPLDHIEKGAKTKKMDMTKFVLKDKSAAGKLGDAVKDSRHSLLSCITLMGQVVIGDKGPAIAGDN
ncbi:hypothetical protein ACJ41O_008737 [Fusarium nematophilum]